MKYSVSVIKKRFRRTACKAAERDEVNNINRNYLPRHTSDVNNHYKKIYRISDWQILGLPMRLVAASPITSRMETGQCAILCKINILHF